MKCRHCLQEYQPNDNLQFEEPYYGWAPSYDACFTCFCVEMFGGWMEPDGSLATHLQPIYGINCPSENPRPGPTRADFTDEEWQEMFP